MFFALHLFFPNIYEGVFLEKKLHHKAAGPSGIVIEVINSAGKEIIKSITNLANRIIKEGRIPSDWNLSYIVSLYKGKGDALFRGSYRDLKMRDQVMKIIERVFDSVMRFQVDDSM